MSTDALPGLAPPLPSQDRQAGSAHVPSLLEKLKQIWETLTTYVWHSRSHWNEAMSQNQSEEPSVIDVLNSKKESIKIQRQFLANSYKVLHGYAIGDDFTLSDVARGLGLPQNAHRETIQQAFDKSAVALLLETTEIHDTIFSEELERIPQASGRERVEFLTKQRWELNQQPQLLQLAISHLREWSEATIDAFKAPSKQLKSQYLTTASTALSSMKKILNGEPEQTTSINSSQNSAKRGKIKFKSLQLTEAIADENPNLDKIMGLASQFYTELTEQNDRVPFKRMALEIAEMSPLSSPLLRPRLALLHVGSGDLDEFGLAL